MALSLELGQQLSRVQQQNQDLRTGLEEARVAAAQKDRVMFENTKLRNELERTKHTVAEQQQQADTARFRHADLEGQVLALTREVGLLRSMDSDGGNQLELENQNLRKELIRSESLNETLRINHEAHLAAMKQLADQTVARIEGEITTGESTRTRMLEDFDLSKAEWNSERTALEQALARLRKQLAELVTADWEGVLRKEQQQHGKDKVEWETARAAMRLEGSEMEDKNSVLINQLKAAEAECTRLSGDLGDERAKLEDASSKIVRLDAQIGALNQQLELVQSEMSQLQASLAECALSETDNEEAQDESSQPADTPPEDVEQQEQSIASAPEAGVEEDSVNHQEAAVQRARAQSINPVEKLKSKIDVLQKELSAAKATVTERDTAISELEAKLFNLQTEADKVPTLEDEVASLRSNLEHAGAEECPQCGVLSRKCSTLQEASADALARAESLEKNAQALRSRLSELEQSGDVGDFSKPELQVSTLPEAKDKLHSFAGCYLLKTVMHESCNMEAKFYRVLSRWRDRVLGTELKLQERDLEHGIAVTKKVFAKWRLTACMRSVRNFCTNMRLDRRAKLAQHKFRKVMARWAMNPALGAMLNWVRFMRWDKFVEQRLAMGQHIVQSMKKRLEDTAKKSAVITFRANMEFSDMVVLKDEDTKVVTVQKEDLEMSTDRVINTLKVAKRALMGKVQSLEKVLAELADKTAAEAITDLVAKATDLETDLASEKGKLAEVLAQLSSVNTDLISLAAQMAPNLASPLPDDPAAIMKLLPTAVKEALDAKMQELEKAEQHFEGVVEETKMLYELLVKKMKSKQAGTEEELQKQKELYVEQAQAHEVEVKEMKAVSKDLQKEVVAQKKEIETQMYEVETAAEHQQSLQARLEGGMAVYEEQLITAAAEKQLLSDQLVAEGAKYEQLEAAKGDVERRALEEQAELVARQAVELSNLREELAEETRCVQTNLDRTERAWHETLSREDELQQEIIRVKAVCHAKQQQCHQGMLMAEARVVASQVVGTAVARAEQRGAAKVVRQIQAQHQCSELEAMQKAVLATVQARHTMTPEQDWSRFEAAVNEVVLDSIAEAENSKESTRLLHESVQDATKSHGAKVEQLSRRAATMAVEMFEDDIDGASMEMDQQSLLHASQLQIQGLGVEREYAEVRHRLGDKMAEAEASLQRLVPLAMAGARTWLNMGLVDFYRRLLGLIGSAMAHLDRRTLVAEALQVEAEALSTETGCGEHDSLLHSVNDAMSLLATMCAAKVQLDKVNTDRTGNQLAETRHKLDGLLQSQAQERAQWRGTQHSESLALEQAEQQLEQERRRAAQIKGERMLSELVNEAQQDQWRETHTQEIQQVGEQLRHLRVQGSNETALDGITPKAAVAEALGRDRSDKTHKVGTLQAEVRSILRNTFLKA